MADACLDDTASDAAGSFTAVMTCDNELNAVGGCIYHAEAQCDRCGRRLCWGCFGSDEYAAREWLSRHHTETRCATCVHLAEREEQDGL